MCKKTVLDYLLAQDLFIFKEVDFGTRNVLTIDFFMQKKGGKFQSSIRTAMKGVKDAKKYIGRAISKIFFYNHIPHNIASSPYYETIIDAIADAGRGVKPPTAWEISNTYLDAEYKEIEEYMKQLEKYWDEYGCTLMCDSWSSQNTKKIINFLVYSTFGIVFIDSIDAIDEFQSAEYICSLMNDMVERIGERVVQVVIDNGANYKAVDHLLMEIRKHLYWTPCAAHCIDLMLEDMTKEEESLIMGMLKKSQLSIPEEATSEDDMNNIDDEMMYSKSESEDGDVALTEPLKDAINNKEGLLEKLEDFAWPDNVDWIQKLSIDYELPEAIDVNDDLAREMSFYTQALDGTRQAFEKLQNMGLPFLRPPDYYAEMVKTDSHMLKIKSKLLVEKKKIEEAEERKKAREAKKIAKEVQAQKNKERAKRKKEEIENVKKWRKQREQSGFAKGKGEELDLDMDSENRLLGLKKRRPGVSPGDRSGGFRGRRKLNKKREMRESKFGHGGRKGMKKQNTAETTNDMRGFNKGNFPGNQRGKK